MAPKEDIRTFLRKQLGRESADNLLKKLKEMQAKRSSEKAIEKVLLRELEKHMEKVKRGVGSRVGVPCP